MSSLIKQKKVATTFTQTKEGGLIKSVLFILAVVLLLAYLGISYTDVKENDFIQYLVSLFTSFWN